MPRKTNDLCMFCTEEELCETHKPKQKKKAAPRKRAASTTAPGASECGSQSSTPDSLPTAPTPPVASQSRGSKVDLKAAMKAAAATRQATEAATPSGAQIRAAIATAVTANQEAGDQELAVAINNLEPILHPDEKVQHQAILNRTDMRAERWKRRNYGNTS